MKDLRGTASARVGAPIEACFALLEAIDGYPRWHPAVVREVTVLERDAHDSPLRARTRLHVGQGVVVKDFDLLMDVVIRRPSTVTLTKVQAGGSDQRFDVAWQLSESESEGTRIELVLFAQLNVPRFIPVGGIGDSLAAGFVAAARDTLVSTR
jgi:ribosome-associated toxin RatA of RatAB toxin-antitoxin module